MKRLISLLLVFAMCIALISISAVSVLADTTKINISRVNSYLDENTSDIVAWASTQSDATVQSIYGAPGEETFCWFYFILLQYNSANGSYTVIDISGFDENGNDIRETDRTYTTWTLGSNKIAVMAKRQATDTDGYNLLRASSIGDTFYLNTTFNTISNTYDAVSDVYFSTQPISGQPGTGGSDDSSEPSEGENVLDLDITAPKYYELGEEFTVSVNVNNITAEDGVSLLKFDLDYDEDKLELLTEVNEDNYGELLCVSSLPNATWENLSYVENGSVTVQILTPETNSANFAKNDGEISLEFKFKAKETASGDLIISADNVIAAQNTSDDVISFVGDGDSVTLTASPYVFDISLEAPESCSIGKEFTLSASVCNITAANGISLIKFSIDYDETSFKLTNEINEDNYDELLCISSLPNATWENLSYVENGVIYIQILTTQTDPSNFAIMDGDITVELTFVALEGATGTASFTIADDNITAGVNTEDGANVVSGHGDTVTVAVKSVEYTRGDIDNDGSITTADYIYVKRAYMGTYTLDEVEFLAADIDMDGTITTADYIYVKRAYMGTYTIA